MEYFVPSRPKFRLYCVYVITRDILESNFLERERQIDRERKREMKFSKSRVNKHLQNKKKNVHDFSLSRNDLSPTFISSIPLIKSRIRKKKGIKNLISPENRKFDIAR